MASSTYLKTVGIGLNLNVPFSQLSGKIATNTGTNRINQSLDMIISTQHGEAPMLYVLGSDLDRYLFEPNNDLVADEVKMAIEDAIEKLEPRITVLTIDVDQYDNVLHVKIEYVIRNTNMSGTFEKDITMETGGDIIGD